MKKTFVACLAVVALFAVATSASAITCTTDQRPAATLLIPYFQATFNPDGTILASGPSALDTIVTIGNASSAPMIAHVSIFSQYSEFVLDFNIALTGFDIQSFSMASILRGFLPQTPISTAHRLGKSASGIRSPSLFPTRQASCASRRGRSVLQPPGWTISSRPRITRMDRSACPTSSPSSTLSMGPWIAPGALGPWTK